MLKLKMNPRKRRSRPEIRDADHILALLDQEHSGKYFVGDYLSMTSKATAGSTVHNIDEYCREQICEWTFRVVDYFRIDREVASVSLSYLDRFLCTTQCDRSSFKLAATTTLYMAVKVFYPNKLGDLGILSDLSRGEFGMLDMANISSLDWKLHPPTAACISQLLLDFLELEGLTEQGVEELYANAAYFAELSVCDYFFVGKSPSTIAFASILNALEGMMQSESQLFAQVASLGFLPMKDLITCRNRLWKLYERSEERALHASTTPQPQMHYTHQQGSFTKLTETLPASSPVSVVCLRSKSVDFFSDRHRLQNRSW
jgi:Cyclin, N-terminal domain/Cyclin, C-terminal domain